MSQQPTVSRTLSKAILKEEVRIKLKIWNTYLTGKLVRFDNYMNLIVKDAKEIYFGRGGKRSKDLGVVMIRGASIIFVGQDREKIIFTHDDNEEEKLLHIEETDDIWEISTKSKKTIIRGAKKWEREHQVRGKKIKQQAIKLVGDVEIILTIVESDFVQVVALEGLQNCANMRGVTEIVLLMEIKVFIEDNLYSKILYIFGKFSNFKFQY